MALVLLYVFDVISGMRLLLLINLNMILLDINIPIAAATAFMVIFFLDVRIPRMPLKEKLMSLDWM